MGTYLNPGSKAYEIAANSEIYIDKSEMLSCLNSVVNTNAGTKTAEEIMLLFSLTIKKMNES